MQAVEFVKTMPKLHAVAVIIRNDAGKILVQDHVKHNFLTMPIGMVEPNELHSQAIVRELKEELDIEAGVITTVLTGNIKCGDDWVDTHIFELMTYRGTIVNKEPHKHRSLMWYSVDELKALRAVGVSIGTTLSVWLDM